MDIILQILILVISVVIHEVAHGYAAYFLGDPTAKYAGRLTFNPIKHLDPWGSVLLPLILVVFNSPILFGWAKPVPYNPYNLRDQKIGPALVGAAGPLSNFLLALLAVVSMRALLISGVYEGLILQILSMFIFINILLLVFNLFPIPPLDGSKLLYAIIPMSEHTKMMLEQYGFVVLLVFISLFGWVIQFVVLYVLQYFTDFVVGVNILEFLM